MKLPLVLAVDMGLQTTRTAKNPPAGNARKCAYTSFVIAGHVPRQVPLPFEGRGAMLALIALGAVAVLLVRPKVCFEGEGIPA